MDVLANRKHAMYSRQPSRVGLVSKAPARPPIRTILAATLSATLALLALVGLGVLTGHFLLIPPMIGSMALIAGAPELWLAQPRNVIGGHTISAFVGLGVGLVSNSIWAAAIAGGFALAAMMLTRTSHSPAAGTAAIAATLTQGRLVFVIGVLAAALVIVLTGITRGGFKQSPYPMYWW